MTTETPEKTWTFTDREGWGPGPWDVEPDKVEWRDSETGYPCIARRSPASGAWCGYVAVPEGHPCFGLSDGDLDIKVHGGLTYAAPCQEGEGEHAVCHVPLPGESDHVWWFGFDTCHAYDDAPMYRVLAYQTRRPFHPIPGLVYRTLDYVKTECASLAHQLWHVGEMAEREKSR